MSKIAFRPRGGMEGIHVTNRELQQASNFFEKEYADQVIPLPGVEPYEQKERLKTCTKNHSRMEGAKYWETPDGSHGWCCGHCGETLQWG